LAGAGFVVVGVLDPDDGVGVSDWPPGATGVVVLGAPVDPDGTVVLAASAGMEL
jgi:hypothetical protein